MGEIVFKNRLLVVGIIYHVFTLIMSFNVLHALTYICICR